MHKQKPRSRLDYFYRTLSTAANQGKGDPIWYTAASAASEPQAADQHCEASEAHPVRHSAPISDREKIALCDRISEELGVEILRIVKLSGKDPVYRVELAEGAIHFDNAGKLINQNAVQVAVAARAGTLIPPFKAAPWRRVAQWMLDACITEEGGEEMEMEGAARLRLVQYLSAIPFIDSLERHNCDNTRKPMVADGFITVCSSDIQTFINKTTSENVSIPAVVGMLYAIGAKSKRFRGKFPEQSRWLLPTDKFSPADYAASAGEERSDDNY